MTEHEPHYVTRGEMDALDQRLREKFEEIEQVREQNSRLALDAAWGVVTGLNTLLLFGGLFLVLQNTEWPWWAEAIAVVATLVLTGVVAYRVNERRMQEIDRLAKIEPWTDHNWS